MADLLAAGGSEIDEIGALRNHALTRSATVGQLYPRAGQNAQIDAATGGGLAAGLHVHDIAAAIVDHRRARYPRRAAGGSGAARTDQDVP